MPSVFIRTSGCNLRCQWCDTPYASLNPEGDQMSVDEIMEEVKKYRSDYVVITGGEPMMVKKVWDLAGKLNNMGKHVTIETAGTIAPDGIKCDLASISPKLSNSTPDDNDWRDRHENLRIQPDILDQWINDYQYQLKFVVSSEDDLNEILEITNRLKNKAPVSNIYLMPEGKTVEEMAANDEIIIKMCKAAGYRYCDRLHIRLFGDTRCT